VGDRAQDMPDPIADVDHSDRISNVESEARDQRLHKCRDAAPQLQLAMNSKTERIDVVRIKHAVVV
jgi:hypothetical protein